MRPSRYLQTMTLLNGRRFKGVLLDEKSDTGVVPSHRQLRSPSKLSSRNLFRAPTGTVYLVADHGFENSYRVFEMDRQLPHARTEKVRDPVTGLPREERLVEKGDIWVALTPAGALTGSLPVDIPEYRLLTGAELMAGDHVGPYVVVRADTLIGITVAEVR